MHSVSTISCVPDARSLKRRAAVARLICLAGAVSVASLLGACLGRPEAAASTGATGLRQPSGSEGTPSAAVFRGSEVRSLEPWSFNGVPGKIITTDHFTIYTTETSNAITDRVPKFLEVAMRQYITAFGPGAALQPPPGKLESFVMGNRQQWKEITLAMLGKQGAEMLNITAGGFAVGGRAFLFDIGIASTFFVAAHEGWHQYTQRTFAEPMPVFLEEGVATYMEGHRWDGAEVQFLPWANLERFEQLRTASQGGRLMSIRDLIETTPRRLIQEPGDAAVTYYAQLWCLLHFLNEGDGGAYRPALQRLLRDAQAGQLSQTVAAQLTMNERGGMLARRQGNAVFRAYFDRDIDGFDKRYQAFVQQIVRTGARDWITQGRSPLPVATVPSVSPAAPLFAERLAIPARGVRRVSVPAPPISVN